MKCSTFVFGFLSLAPILTAGPFPCKPGTLASYIALGVSGCGVGNIEFVNFSYNSNAGGGAPQITPDQIQVTPVMGMGEQASLMFSANWQAGSGQSQESSIRYTVIVFASISSGSLNLQLGTSQAGQPGHVSVSENTSMGNLQVYNRCGSSCSSKTTDTLNFTPAPHNFAVTTKVKLSTTSGTSSLSSFTSLVNFCPPCASGRSPF